MTEIYLHIVARMADYIRTHPYERMPCSHAQHELAKAHFPMLEWYRCQPAAEQVERDWGLTMSDTIRPSAQELKMNSRSRSALLHVLTKQKVSEYAHRKM